MAIKLHLINTRVSFAKGLFTPSAAVEGGVKKFGADFILDEKSQVVRVEADGKKVKTTLEAAELAVAKEAWKANGEKMLKSLEPSKRAVRDGDAKVDKAGNPRPGYEGHTYVTAKNETRPTIVDRGRREIKAEDGTIYSGCRVTAIIELYANTTPNKKGVFASLLGVQFVEDDESFGGGRAASADEFEELSEGTDGEDFGA